MQRSRSARADNNFRVSKAFSLFDGVLATDLLRSAAGYEPCGFSSCRVAPLFVEGESCVGLLGRLL